MAFPFQSQLFKGDHELELCAANDRDHIKKSASGDHVDKIQQALIRIAQDEPDLKAKVRISQAEINSKTYGSTTEAAVLAYKTKRKIINRAYQTAADNIVGKMTISKLDDEIAIKEGHAPSGTAHAQVIQNAFNASRQSIRAVQLILRSLETSINNISGLDEPEKTKALTVLLSARARDILVLSRRLLTSADPLSAQFRDALHKTIDLLQQNLNQVATVVDQGATGRCDPAIRTPPAIPFASTQRKDPEPRVSVCNPFFDSRKEDLQRDVITHEFFHLLGGLNVGFDTDHSVTNTQQALTNPNTLTQIIARLNDRTRQVNSDGHEPDLPPLPMP
jgi:hypothetical protein